MARKSFSLSGKFRDWVDRISLRRLGYLISTCITGGALVVLFSLSRSTTRTSLRFIDSLELSTLDLRFSIRGVRPHDENIVIIGMDEKTLQGVGAFPIPRNAYARLLDQLTKGGAKIVSFDVNFPTPEKNSAVDALQKLLAEIGPDAPAEVTDKIHEVESASNNDRIFADAIKRSGNVVLGEMFLDSEQAMSVSPQVASEYYNLASNHPFPQVRKIGKNFDIDDVWVAHPENLTEATMFIDGVYANIRPLAEAARSYGFFNVVPDADATYRRAALLLRYQKLDFYPSLDLETVRQYEDIKDESSAAYIGPNGMDFLALGPHTIKTDYDGTVVINFAGPYQTYQQYSMIDVIDGAVPPETFRGKIVLVGATALAIGDRRNTPFSSFNDRYMGVEIHANVIDNILHNEELGRGFLSHGLSEAAIDTGFVILFGLGLSAWFSRQRPLVATATVILAAGAFLALNYYAFFHWGMWLSVVVPMATLVGNYATIISTRAFFEEREKLKVRKTFERYVSPGVIKLIEEDPKKYFKTGGESKELTILFSDIREFTRICEGLTPDEVVHLLNEYLGEMTDILFTSRGTLDKYIGDAIMAFWGSPFPDMNHAELACACALKMSARLDELNLKWQMEGKKPLNIGIGINTGVVNVGNMGSSRRFAWTVMGDPVNLSSRLEGATKKYHVRVLVSEFTYEHKYKRKLQEERGGAREDKYEVKQIKDSFVFRELDKIRVPGKDLPVGIFELLAQAKDAARYNDLLVYWSDAYAAYKRRHWPEAAEKFEAMRRRFPEDGPAKVYFERVLGYLKAPPPADWDGVFVFKEK